ncbi:MAG: DUF898 domain-containing protein [Wolinella succinogenes]|uniref:YjgN family protein n=1 Tax=Wolinella succinogenes TaxID=844 RepID=UPI0016B34E04|nr:YjgN family protein [Wolinella succinogenes]NLU35086.1 DUF898 domain-containing protein [Wolinella succinogenes]
MSTRYPLNFTGKGSEYFKIWIVNIALSLITLGIYSAWAKVRTNRWFYGHTILDHQAFVYLATPMQILKGRLIAAAFFIAYVITSEILPLVGMGILLLILALSPLIIVRSLRFNALQSSYRGIRFGFVGSVSGAAKAFLLWPFVSLITLGLALPYAAYVQVKYLASNYTYGSVQCLYEGQSKPFWKLYIWVFALVALPLGLMMLGFFGLMASSAFEKGARASLLLVMIVLLYTLVPIAMAIIKTRVANLFYNHTQMGEARFRSTQRAREMLWIYFSNLFLVMVTLGLFTPFASVRIARYKALHLEVIAPDLESYSAKIQSDVGALGSEMSDFFDMDVGVG